jgi:hypothetical protein
MRHGLPALPVLRLPSSRVPSVSNSPTQRYGTLDRTFIFRSQRPISAYDAPALVGHRPGVADLDAEGVVRANGIRVWYSSFSSIDWLHDAIKDSMRMYRLRRHKSVRGRMRSASDRFVGWIIVTIVGFLTAIAAFLVVRSEQWLFDIKYGYCVSGWWKARRFCCLDISDARTFALGASMETPCGAWMPWGDALTNAGASQLSRILVGRASYSLLAVRITPFLFSSPKESLILVASPRASLFHPYPLSDRIDLLRHAQGLWSAFPRFCLPVRGPKGFRATIRSSRKTPGTILRRRQRYTRDKNHPFWSVCFMSDFGVFFFFDDSLYRQVLLYMVTSEVALSSPRPLVWLSPSHRVSTSARKVLLCT